MEINLYIVVRAAYLGVLIYIRWSVVNIWKGVTALRKLGHVLIRLLTQAGWDSDKEFWQNLKKKKWQESSQRKRKKTLTGELVELDRKIMTATETVLQRVTPCMQDCVDVLQPTEHMGEWNNLLSALLPLPSQRPHGIFSRGACGEAALRSTPGYVGKPSGGTDCDLCFPPHESVSIWPFLRG